MTREEAVSIIEDRVRVTEYVKSSYVDCVDVEALKMAIEALKGKDTNVPSRKGVFIPDITVEMFRNASLEGVEDFMTSGEMEDISLPSAQQEQSIAQERYEDLCEYFKDCSDQGRSTLNDRKEFKSWLDRMKWHVMECDKLGRELMKLKSAQPEIIRCKECKHSIDFYNDGECYCRRPNRELDWIGDWNFYCGCAERREE